MRPVVGYAEDQAIQAVSQQVCIVLDRLDRVTVNIADLDTSIEQGI